MVANLKRFESEERKVLQRKVISYTIISGCALSFAENYGRIYVPML